MPPGTPLSIPEQKRDLRARLRAKRKALGNDKHREFSERICAHILALPAWKSAEVVMIYLALPTEEPDTDTLAGTALSEGKRLCVPRVDGETGEMSVIEVPSLHAMAMSTLPLPIRQPGAGMGTPCSPARIDLNLIPCVGADMWGVRLGLGGGHYDRLLVQMRPDAVNLGLLFSCQLIEHLPREPHDQRLCGFVTEEGIVWRK